MFDWLVILLYGSALELDDLQFTYQSGYSTWSVLETIDYFNRNGSDIIVCCMDMTKAFDLVKHSILFEKLRESGIPPIFLRLLIFIYMNQYACVKWNNSSSDLLSQPSPVQFRLGRQGRV